ncbi:MAG TPA: hypothetical protein VFA33_05080 [Bryobacteraceae bacterium]|nr:hypothetical protein [Bryobacteraceae bacterium]
MPDNVSISPGQGAVIATDQDPQTGAHYQRVKLMDGTEGSRDAIQSDGQGSLQTYVTEADIEDLKTGNANVKVVNGPDEVLHVRIVHQGRSQSGSCVPVVLASDHDPVPIASANLPLLGGALGANGAIWGPIPLAGANGLTLQVSGTYNLTVIFEATVADPVLGPWVTVAGCRTTNGQLDSNPAINALNLAWDFMLSGFAYFRVRVTVFTSGLAQLQASRYTNATEPSPSVVAHGMSGGNPIALGVDASGRPTILGPLTIGAALGSTLMVPVVGGDGTSSGFARQPTAAIDGTPQNGQTTNQPTFLLIGGVDGLPVVSPSYAAPNPSMVGTARKLLTDSTGVLQVADSAITLLRQELRETNALLLLILQALAGGDALDIKGGVMPAHLPIQ